MRSKLSRGTSVVSIASNTSCESSANGRTKCGNPGRHCQVQKAVGNRTALTMQSSRPAYGGRLTFGVSALISHLCRPLLIPGFCLSQRLLLWGLGRPPGFACMRCASLQLFWPLALANQAPPAIILAALRRFRGPALFRGLRPSSRLGAPFWPSGLTIRRSRPPSAAAELRALTSGQRSSIYDR